MERNPGTCLDTNSNFYVLLWEVPDCHDPEPGRGAVRPRPQRRAPTARVPHIKVVVQAVSPGSRKADKLDKMAEYADAGIPDRSRDSDDGPGPRFPWGPAGRLGARPLALQHARSLTSGT